MSSRQLTEAGCSSAPGSHSKSFDHSHYRPYQGGGGDSGDALSVTSVSSSGSDLEDVNASFLSDSPEGHERKVRKKDGTEKRLSTGDDVTGLLLSQSLRLLVASFHN